MNKRGKITAWVAAAALVVGGSAAGVAALTAGQVDEPAAPAKIVQEQPATIDLEPETTPEPTVEPVAPAPEPEPAPEPVTPAPPPPPPAPAPGASGSQVPFYPSSDPQNASGGEWADPGSYCHSGSASTVGGVPVCD